MRDCFLTYPVSASHDCYNTTVCSYFIALVISGHDDSRLVYDLYEIASAQFCNPTPLRLSALPPC